MTKRLPDFNTSMIWKELRHKMGATATVEMPSLNIDQISLEEFNKLKTGNLDIENIKDHIDPIDGTFNYKGQKVILYIKQQLRRMSELHNPRWEYKYHLCFCKHLNKMESEGRFKTRYVVTQRVDGQFLVDIIAIETKRYIKEDDLCAMNVCKLCLRHLSEQYPGQPLFNYNAFNLSTFLDNYNTRHTKRPLHTPDSIPKNDYPDNWKALSIKIRENANFICSDCRKSFKDRQQDLHVHHIDGIKWNNSANNLKVLCIDCHGHQPGHQHLLSNQKINNSVRKY